MGCAVVLIGIILGLPVLAALIGMLSVGITLFVAATTISIIFYARRESRRERGKRLGAWIAVPVALYAISVPLMVMALSPFVNAWSEQMAFEQEQLESRAQQEAEEARQVQVGPLMESIESKDADDLVALFSEQVSLSYDLGPQADELLAFIEGDVVSYGEAQKVFSVNEAATAEGPAQRIGMYVDDVRTDAGGHYGIGYEYYLSSYSGDARNGVTRVWVNDYSVYTRENGYPASGRRVMGEG